MKPTKNRFFCKDCRKIKMLFDTEKKAENFIKFNSEEIEAETGFKPERSYFCIACNGWHLTHKKEILNIKSRTEIIQDLYNQEREQKAVVKEVKKQQKAVRIKLEIEQQRALEQQQQKALQKEKRKAQEKEKEALKKEQNALKREQKTEELKKSLDSVELYIAILTKFRPNDNKCIEILNKALGELENAKSIRVVFKRSNKRKRDAEEKLNILSREIKNTMKQ